VLVGGGGGGGASILGYNLEELHLRGCRQPVWPTKGENTETVWYSKGRFQPFKAGNVISTMCQVSAVFRKGPHTASENSKHSLNKL